LESLKSDEAFVEVDVAADELVQMFLELGILGMPIEAKGYGFSKDT